METKTSKEVVHVEERYNMILFAFEQLPRFLFQYRISWDFQLNKHVNKHSVKAHAYANDSQLYLSFKPGHIDNQNAATNTITNCIKDIQRWMTCSKLKMKDGTTEFMIIGTRQQLSKQSINHLTVGTSSIEPSSSVRNLGTVFDTNLSLDKQIASTCKSSFYYLYNIRNIRKFLRHSS